MYSNYWPISYSFRDKKAIIEKFSNPVYLTPALSGIGVGTGGGGGHRGHVPPAVGEGTSHVFPQITCMAASTYQ